MRCTFYALIAVLALYGTWSENVTIGGSNPVQIFANFLEGLKVNAAGRSIGIDIGLFLLAAATLMIVEARRLGIRFVWAYILFGFLVAISVTFPLFLIAREMRLARIGSVQGDTEMRQTVLDTAGIALTTIIVFVLFWYLKT